MCSYGLSVPADRMLAVRAATSRRARGDLRGGAAPLPPCKGQAQLAHSKKTGALAGQLSLSVLSGASPWILCCQGIHDPEPCRRRLHDSASGRRSQLTIEISGGAECAVRWMSLVDICLPAQIPRALDHPHTRRRRGSTCAHRFPSRASPRLVSGLFDLARQW